MYKHWMLSEKQIAEAANETHLELSRKAEYITLYGEVEFNATWKIHTTELKNWNRYLHKRQKQVN